MDDDKFTLFDEIEEQNNENGNSEPQQSQLQPQVYQPPKSQEYQTPAPQYYQPPQPQLYQPPQPQSQEYQTPQPQTLSKPLYQPSDNQNPQPQSQDQSHYLAQNEFNTPNQNPLNQPIANNVYRGESNQTQIQEMSSNPVINNNEIFKDPNKDLNNRRLRIQIILIVLLLLNIPIKIFNYFLINKKEKGLFFASIIIGDIPILIVGIWMIVLTKRGKTEKNNNLGPTSLSAFILNLFFMLLTSNGFLILAYIYKLIILLIIAIFNMKCNSRD